jgi:hypothetical protein
MKLYFYFANLILFSTLEYSDSLVGKTTRYWDCCKVSCSWPYKGKYKNSPLHTGPVACKEGKKVFTLKPLYLERLDKWFLKIYLFK